MRQLVNRPDTVFARLDRAIQYAATSRRISIAAGILDHPLEPVIGLAEGETRWRVMTTLVVITADAQQRR
jgi:hypothetical protein